MHSIEVEKVDAAHVEGASSLEMEARSKEEKALVRKMDMFLMPTMWFMYLFSYADRTK